MVMTLATEYVDSVYRRWMSSCLSCLQPLGDDVHVKKGNNSGVEREMKICHNQPHLVPPMKLVFYDDMPSTPTVRSSSQRVSQWVSEGRNLASRASSRASLSMRRRTSRKPQIGVPSDFRRVDPPRARLEPFRPLELSIYLPGNRLSDLPVFSESDFDALGDLQFPPKALIRSRSETLLSQSSGSFCIPRKPIASMVAETSLNYGRRTPSQSRPSCTDALNNPVETSPARTRSTSEPPSMPRRMSSNDTLPRLQTTLEEPCGTIIEEIVDSIPEYPAIPSEPVYPVSPITDHQLPTTSHEQDPSFSIPPPIKSALPLPPPQPPTPSTIPSRHRVTQWLSRFPSTSTHASRKSTGTRQPFYQCVASSPPQPSMTMSSRTRTMSVSTVSSTIMSGINTPSLSSMTTMTHVPMSPARRARTSTDKGLVGTTSFPSDEKEGLPPAYEENYPEYEDKGAREGVRVSTVGLAF